MSPSVSRWTRALKLIWKQHATFGQESVKFIGRDHMGNKYFEANRPNHSRQVQRYFEREKKNDLEDVADVANVPPMWDAWLRFRRQNPPSDEEMNDAEEYYQMQQEMAAGRKLKEDSELKERKKDEVPLTWKQQSRE